VLGGMDVERRLSVVAGLALVLLGALALVGQQFGLDPFGLGWPLWVIGPGVVLFAASFAVGGPAGVGLAIPGAIVTVVGLVLAVQQATGLWATWAYVWALVAPGGVGLGMAAYGVVTGRRELVRTGFPLIGIGLALFLGFGLFFEGVLRISGAAMPDIRSILAGGLVLLGLLVLASAALRRDER
jgi:hypothetical protein